MVHGLLVENGVVVNVALFKKAEDVFSGMVVDSTRKVSVGATTTDGISFTNQEKVTTLSEEEKAKVNSKAKREESLDALANIYSDGQMVERATDAEAAAGTDNTRYITPKQLADNTVVGAGGGSSSNADTLDNHDSTYFQRSVADERVFEIAGNLSGDRNVLLDFHADDTYTDYSTRIMRKSGSNGALTIDQRGSGDINLNGGGILKRNGHKVWDAGSDGPWSGMNADMLDGYHHNSFVKPGETFTAGHHTEGNLLRSAALTNDFGNIRVRGANFTFTGVSPTDDQIDAMFNGLSSYYLFQIPTGTEVVIEFTLPRNLRWYTNVGIGFGSHAFRANRVKIEAFSSGNWVTCSDTTSNTSEDVLNVVPGNAGGDGTTKVRYTLGGQQGSSVRIAHLWGYNFDSAMWSELQMPRAGGTMYGSLDVTGDVTLTGTVDGRYWCHGCYRCYWGWWVYFSTAFF